MEVRVRPLILCLVTCALTTALADNPYRAIVVRNAFGLNPEPPPPPPPPVEVIPPEPTPTVRLTGITSITKPPKAIFEIQNPGERDVIKPPPLAAGTSMNGVEVLEIDLVAKSVRIRTGNLETNVTFEVAKLSTLPPPSVAAARAAALNMVKTRSGRQLPPAVRQANQPDRTPGYRPPPTTSVQPSNSRVMVGGATPNPPPSSPFTTGNPSTGNIRVGGGSATTIPSRQVRRSGLTTEQALKLLEMQRSVLPPPLPPGQ